MIRPALAALLFVLAGCHGSDEDATSAEAARTGARSTKTVAVPAMAPFSVHPDRNLSDLVPGCPNMSPASRPRGSNCHGVFPEQCGADRAAAFQGQQLDSSLKEQLAAIEPPGGVRYTDYGQPVANDLRPGRLNIELSGGKTSTVMKVDCY